jgi:hypothetical protein
VAGKKLLATADKAAIPLLGAVLPLPLNISVKSIIDGAEIA